LLALLIGSQIFLAGQPAAPALPGQYFRLLENGYCTSSQQLATEPSADLKTLEARGDSWRLFPHTILVAAVLYAKAGTTNHRYHDPKMLSLAIKNRRPPGR